MNEDTPAPRTPHRRDGDADVLALAEGLLTSLNKTFDRGDLEIFQTVVDSYPDVGRDGAGDVVASLTGLITDFLAQERCDREAIAVHVRAWRFMTNCQPDPAERARILSGLRTVRDLYVAA